MIEFTPLYAELKATPDVRAAICVLIADLSKRVKAMGDSAGSASDPKTYNDLKTGVLRLADQMFNGKEDLASACCDAKDIGRTTTVQNPPSGYPTTTVDAQGRTVTGTPQGYPNGPSQPTAQMNVHPDPVSHPVNLTPTASTVREPTTSPPTDPRSPATNPNDPNYGKRPV
jgi:hypothetical protein